MQFGNPAWYIALFLVLIVAVASFVRVILMKESQRKARLGELVAKVRRILQLSSYSNNQEWVDSGDGWREQVFQIFRDPRYNAMQSLLWAILRVGRSEIEIILTYPQNEAIPAGLHHKVHDRVAELSEIFQKMGITPKIKVFEGPHLIIMPTSAA